MKKDKPFNNPADQFFSSNSKHDSDHSSDEAIENASESSSQPIDRDKFKLDPRLIEKRTRRVNVLMQPSLYDLIKKRAQEENTSVNDTIHKILEKELRGGNND